MDRTLSPLPKWRQRLPALLIAVVLVLAVALFAIRPTHLPVADSPRLARVVAGEFRDEVAVRARVEPMRSVQLDAVEAGRVEAVFVQDGDQVGAGAPLYRLHSPEQEQLLMERGAEVAQQLANVSVQRSALTASMAQNRRELAQLQAAQQKAEAEFKRLAKLASAQFISVAAAEAAERDFQLATQLLNQAREDQRIETETRRRSLDELARAVEGLQNGLQMLERARERLQQHAPLAGRLSGFQLQVGASVRPGDRLGRIDDVNGGVQLVADVDEYYLPRLQAGQRATTQASGELELVQTLPQIRDGKARVLLRWMDPSAPPAGLRPGQAVEVRLQLSESSRALLLPEGPGVQAQLYVRSGRELHRRAVQLGRRAAGQVEVLAGLRVGDEVLISEPPMDAEKLALP